MSRFFAPLFLSLAACAADGIPLDALETTGQSVWVVGSLDATQPEWNSGITTNLSAWQTVRCDSLHTIEHFVVGFDGFRDKGSLDNYLARLEVKCGPYADMGEGPVGYNNFEWDGTSVEHLLLSSSYQDLGSSALYGLNHYPIGIHLRVNANNYVKDLQLLYGWNMGGWIGDYGTPDELGWITGFSGTEVELMCPDQTVLVGVAARTSTGNGKIRRLKIYCRELEDL